MLRPSLLLYAHAEHAQQCRPIIVTAEVTAIVWRSVLRCIRSPGLAISVSGAISVVR
jgi:hypothetical protein